MSRSACCDACLQSRQLCACTQDGFSVYSERDTDPCNAFRRSSASPSDYLGGSVSGLNTYFVVYQKKQLCVKFKHMVFSWNMWVDCIRSYWCARVQECISYDIACAEHRRNVCRFLKSNCEYVKHGVRSRT